MDTKTRTWNDGWKKLRIHLERRRIKTDGKVALAELALHLAVPVESFFRSLSASDTDDFEKLYTMLRERFSSKDRVWLMRHKLTAGKRGPNEPLDRFIEDLQHMFDNLELTKKEKVWFFTQGSHTDTQKEVLIRQPRTLREAENFARLTQTAQKSIKESQGSDALTRMQQQLDNVVSTMTKGPSKPQATVSAYQFSPQYTTKLKERLINP